MQLQSRGNCPSAWWDSSGWASPECGSTKEQRAIGTPVFGSGVFLA
jgi:hypothetical protein